MQNSKEKKSRFNILFLILLFVFSHQINFAQSDKSTDSLKRTIALQTDEEKQMWANYELAKLFVSTNFDSAGIYYQKALLLAQNQNNKEVASEIYINISKLQTKKSEYEKAAVNCEKAIELAQEIKADDLLIIANLLSAKIKITSNNYSEVLPILEPTLENAVQLNDSTLIADCYDTYGTYYFYSDLAKSIEYYLKSLRILEKQGESERVLTQNVNIGTLYGRIGQNEKAIKYLLKGAEIAKNVNLDYVLSTVYNNLAVIFFEMQDISQSKFYLEEALKIATKLKDEPMICGIVVNLGEIYQGEKKYDIAMDYYQQGLNNPSINNLPDQKIYTLHNIATLYYDLKEFQTAIQYANNALSIANSQNISIHNAELYQVLAESYEKRNDYKAALENQKLFKTYNDSIFNIENTEKIAEIQSKYDFENAENENILLKKDNKIQALTIAKQRNLQLLLFIIIFLIITSIVLVYLRMKKDRRINVILSAKNEEIKLKSFELEKANISKDKFFSILAHDLRNPFNSILGSLEILKHDYEKLNDKERIHFIDLIHKSAVTTNELLSNLLDWSLAQRGKIVLEKKHRDIYKIVQESVNIHNNLSQKKKISVENEIAENTTAFIDHKTLLITINNLINNAIKFTPEKGNIKIYSEKVDGFLQINVNDSGIGIPSGILNSLFKIESTKSRMGTNEEPGTGLGLILCKEFIEKNGGSIWVKSEEGKGSCFTISLPLAEN